MGKRKRSGSFTKTDDSGAKRSDDCDSQEELDGDLLIPLKNSNGVRCSARVQEKQEKLRREASPSKQIIVDVNVQTLGGGASSSAVARSSKRPVFPDEFDVLSTEELTVRLKLNAKDKRKKRNWELWSLEDKQLFFEALNEHGKDFDAIQNYFATKLKPKSKSGQCLQPLSKNKDQVRHFYYRTWNKISKYLQFPKDMKKAFQELYGLVNYGELRKKLRVLNSKTAVKLSELVQKGTTAIKVRGKTFRIKTPVCRALKRLNRLEDIEHSRVPCKISLELIPKNGKAWAAVQGMSHNPRVKVHVPLQRTLASVITYFEDKWKSKAERLKQEMAYTFGGKPVPRLRVFPFEKNDVNLPIFKLSENTSSAKISLRSYTENVLSKEIDEELELCTKKLKRRRKQSDCCGPAQGALLPGHFASLFNGSEAYDSQAEADASDMDISDVPSKPCHAHQCPASDDDALPLPTEEGARPEPTKPDLAAEVSGVDTPTDIDELENAVDDGLAEGGDLAQVCSVCTSRGGEAEDLLAHVLDEETVQAGWTAAEAGVMTVGELYLMMGKCEKLCFEYCWDTPEEISDGARINRMLDKLVSLASSLKKKKSSRTKSGAAGSLAPPGPAPCSYCGHKDGGTPPVPSPPTNPTLLKPALAPGSHFKGARGSGSEGPPIQQPVTPVSVPVPTTPAVEPLLANIVFSPTLPTPLYGGAAKAVRTILPNPMPTSSELNLSAGSSSKPKLPANTGDGLSGLSPLVAVASPAVATLHDLPPSDNKEELESKQLEGFVLSTPMPINAPSPKVPPPVEARDVNSTEAAAGSSEETETGPAETPPAIHQTLNKVSEDKAGEATFRRPGQVPIRSDVSDPKATPPKPFLDLPKGNRRLGRKPNWKRMVIPRELPLLPKFTVPSSVISLSPASANNPAGPLIMSTTNSQILIPLGQPIGNLSAEVLVSSTLVTTPSPGLGAPARTAPPAGSREVAPVPKHPAQQMSTGVSGPRRITPTTLPPSRGAETRGGECPVGSSKRNFPLSEASAASGREVNICDEILSVRSISMSSSPFEELLKVREREAEHTAADMESNLSLSSFMEISLPESTKQEASAFTASDRFLDMGMDESVNSNLSMSDYQERGADQVLAKSVMAKDAAEYFELQSLKNSKEAATSERAKKPPSALGVSRSQSPSFPSQIQSFLDNQWSEPGDLSLSSLLGALEPIRSTTAISESDFQYMLGDSSQDVDFSSRLSEIINDSKSSPHAPFKK